MAIWGEDTGPDAPGSAVLNGNLRIGNSSGTTPRELTLNEGFTLEFEQNRVLTLAGADIITTPTSVGSVIGGPGQLLISTASGEFTISVRNGNGPGSPELVRAAIQNLVVNKPSGNVNFIREPNIANKRAELAIDDNDITTAGFAKLDVQAGAVSKRTATTFALWRSQAKILMTMTL